MVILTIYVKLWGANASNPSKSSGVTVDFDTLKPMLMRQFFAAGKKPSSGMGGDFKQVIADHLFDLG